MSDLTATHLLHNLAPASYSGVVLALSGGLDSMVLLHLLVAARKLQPFPLSAVYINHGISESANQWGAFCQEQCRLVEVEFTQVAVHLPGRANLESRARQARYEALQRFIPSAGHVLLTAHHADDQIESLLLALKRGAGPAGLAGIANARRFGPGWLKRPLLAFNRAQLAQYAERHQLSWIEDDSNSDARFDRNFIRQQITPVLTSRWPHFASAAQRSMQHLANLQQLADHYTEQALLTCVDGDKLDLTALGKLISPQQDLVLRRWLKNYDLNPPAQWLQTLYQQVINARHDACPVLILASYQIRRYDRFLYILKPQVTSPIPGCLSWQGQSQINLPDNAGTLLFSTNAESDAVPVNHNTAIVEFGKLSLPFKPAGSQMHKPLKQWFKIWQIPPWQRGRIPLLTHDGKIIVVAGLASACLPEQATYYLRWQQS